MNEGSVAHNAGSSATASSLHAVGARSRPEPLLRLRWRAPREPGGDVEIVLAILAVTTLGAFTLLPLDKLAPLLGGCTFHTLTGIPCMSCGMTRAVLALSHHEWLLALRMNPLFVVALGSLAFYSPVAAVLSLGRLPRPRLAWRSRSARRIVWIGALSLLLLNWAFLIWDGR